MVSIMIRTRSLPILLVTALAAACAASPPAAPPRDLKGQSELQDAIKKRDLLEQKLAAATPEHRQRCEFQTGDCRLEVSERADAILGAHPTARCRSAADKTAELACVLEELALSGKKGKAIGFYEYQSECLDQILSCTGGVFEKAEAAKHEQIKNERRKRIESSREAIAFAARLTFASERVAYARTALPPNEEEACQKAEQLERCQADTESLESNFEAELDKPQAEYSDARALQLFTSIRSAQAKCFEPEYTCLARRLDVYGGNADTRKALAQTLKALEKREELVNDIAGPAAKGCLMTAVQKHQPNIVENYQRFAREPVTFFQSKLHGAFRSLYEAQISCLSRLHRPARASLAEAGANKTAAAPGAK